MKVTVNRIKPIRKRMCLYCGKERTLYNFSVSQIFDNRIGANMCKKCLLEMVYRLNEVVANEITRG